MSECRAGAPVRNDAGDVLWTWECTLPAGPHAVHEVRDADGTVLAWWPEGKGFLVAELRLEHRDLPDPATLPAPAAPVACATCRHWGRGYEGHGFPDELRASWGYCRGVPNRDDADPSTGLAWADDTEGLGGGYLITRDTFGCALHRPREEPS